MMNLDLLIGGILGSVGGIVFILLHKYLGYKVVEFWRKVDYRVMSRLYLIFGIVFFIFGLFMMIKSFI